MAAQGTPADWYVDPTDPTGTTLRYWDGSAWTEHTAAKPSESAEARPQTTTQAPAAGWHDDPEDPSQLRYWDGTSWTDHRSPKPAPDPQPAPEPPSVPPSAQVDSPTGDGGFPELPPKHSGPLTSKRAAVEEAERLRAVLDSMGYGERRALQEEVESLVGRIGKLRATAEGIENQIVALQSRLVDMSDESVLQEVGLYQFAHPLDTSVEYSEWLSRLRAHCKDLQKMDLAVTATTSWTVNNSQKQGERMVRDLSKLMLRAYNAEAENCVRTVKPSNRDRVSDRLAKTREAIAKLGAAMNIRISDEYHMARLEEIRVTADFLAKKELEKEAERERRAEEREIEKANREFEAEKKRMLKERQQYEDALRQLRDNGDESAAAEMEQRLAEIDDGIEGLTERFANRRAGHVYVISNIGAFGHGVVKIGMTRRLEPMDRVRELGDASVPFRYDVHAMFFSDDAVALETELHRRFEPHRVNFANRHREFFYVTPAQVRDALAELDGHVLEFTEEAVAEEYRQSENERRAVYGTDTGPTTKKPGAENAVPSAPA